MAEDAKGADRKTQPRFSQFALAAARDTSAFETPTASVERPSAVGAGENEPATARVAELVSDEQARIGVAPASPAGPKRTRTTKLAAAPAEVADEELVSFTVRLPASLYMRMRRSLGLREKLGELCIAAITRELDLRR